MKQFISRYNGFCRKCRGEIKVGDPINWEPGHSEHVTCPDIVTPAAPVSLVKPGFTLASYGVPQDLELHHHGSHLAVKGNNTADDVTFFRMKRAGKDSNFAGWVFIYWVYGDQEYRRIARQRPGSDKLEFYPDEGNAGHSYESRFGDLIFFALDDPQKAMKLYGSKIGRCGYCHKQLTDETSRAYGIGPECRKAHRI